MAYAYYEKLARINLTTGTVEMQELPVTLPEYYKVRGWEAAFPTDETLKRLGLDECIGK